MTRVGDKISVNIDVRLLDLQSMKQQQHQNNNRPDYSGLDPLDRHIRKLENSIDQVSNSSQTSIVVQIDCINIIQCRNARRKRLSVAG